MGEFKKKSTEEEAKGTGQSIKGKIKEGAGALTGREDWEAEGEVDQAEGETRKGLGRAGRKISETAESVSDAITGED
jgi:uncharacterized protein YjbJ (UPF0337 family)